MINFFDISIQIRRLIKLILDLLTNLNIILPLEIIVIIIFLVGFYFFRKIINTIYINNKNSKKKSINDNTINYYNDNICKERVKKKLHMIKKLIKENIFNKNIVIKMVNEIKKDSNFKIELEKYNLYKIRNISCNIKKKLKSLEKVIKNKFKYDEMKSKLVVIVLLYYIDQKKNKIKY